jgi:hypothetical protein
VDYSITFLLLIVGIWTGLYGPKILINGKEMNYQPQVLINGKEMNYQPPQNGHVAPQLHHVGDWSDEEIDSFPTTPCNTSAIATLTCKFHVLVIKKIVLKMSVISKFYKTCT